MSGRRDCMATAGVRRNWRRRERHSRTWWCATPGRSRRTIRVDGGLVERPRTVEETDHRVLRTEFPERFRLDGVGDRRELGADGADEAIEVASVARVVDLRELSRIDAVGPLPDLAEQLQCGRHRTDRTMGRQQRQALAEPVELEGERSWVAAVGEQQVDRRGGER